MHSPRFESSWRSPHMHRRCPGGAALPGDYDLRVGRVARDSVLVHDHAANIATFDKVVDGDIDIVDAIASRDQLIEFEVPRPVKRHLPQDVHCGATHAIEASLNSLLIPRQHENTDGN